MVTAAAAAAVEVLIRPCEHTEAAADEDEVRAQTGLEYARRPPRMMEYVCVCGEGE